MYRSTIVDDLLFGQPVNMLLRFERWRARRFNSPVTPESIAIVIVNFNTKDVLATTIDAVRRFSPPGVRMVVVDNASSDGSREWLREQSDDLEVILLPVNIGHGRALDLAVFRTRVDVIVTLDSDAFPYTERWLERLTSGLSTDIDAIGWQGRRDRLHPCCAAYRRRALFDLDLSFANFAFEPREPAAVFGVSTWDTGELISEALGPERYGLVPNWNTEFGGMVMDDIVYHHCGVTTLAVDASDSRRNTGHDRQWEEAVESFLRTPGRVR